MVVISHAAWITSHADIGENLMSFTWSVFLNRGLRPLIPPCNHLQVLILTKTTPPHPISSHAWHSGLRKRYACPSTSGPRSAPARPAGHDAPQARKVVGLHR